MTLEDPLAIVSFLELMESIPQLLDVGEGLHPQQILLKDADESLGAAVTLWLADERRRALDPQERQLSLECVREVGGAVVVTDRQPLTHIGCEPTESLGHRLANRRAGRVRCGVFADGGDRRLRVVAGGAEATRSRARPAPTTTYRGGWRMTVIAVTLPLSLAYAGYPYLVRLMIPKKLRGIKMEQKDIPNISKGEKITFAVITSTLLSFLFPVASPLFMGFFLGIVIRESGVKPFIDFIGGPVLYGATFFLGLLLGVLFEASTILDPKVLLLLILGITALLLSGIGGIIGGYVVYWMSGRTFNPVIGIAGVSCLPTTAKVAQKEAHAANKFAIILPWAMGASVSGVITSAIIAGIWG